MIDNDNKNKNFSAKDAYIYARKAINEKFKKMQERKNLINEVEKRLVKKYDLKAK